MFVKIRYGNKVDLLSHYVNLKFIHFLNNYNVQLRKIVIWLKTDSLLNIMQPISTISDIETWDTYVGKVIFATNCKNHL